MKKSIVAIFMWLMITLSAQAQNELKGNITDEFNTGIPSVTIQVLSMDSAFVYGAVTDDNGVFTFKDIKRGKYILAVSCISYISQHVNFEKTENTQILPPVTLKTDNILLDGVEIKGSSFIQKKDHLLVIPDRQQIKHAYSGYDLLYNLMIPGVSVNRREGTVATSQGAATIYINGVRADFREVRNLRPKDIEKVEYYDRPAGEYLGDKASINYITKTYKTGGYVAFDGEQNIGYPAGKYDLGTKIAHNNTSYTFFGGYNMKKHDGISTEKDEDIFFPDYTVNRNRITEDADFSNNQQYAQLKVNNSTPKRSLFGLVSFVRNATPHNDRKEFLRYSGYEDQDIQSDEKIDQQSLKPAISLDGVFHPTENQRIRVMLNGSYTQNTYDRNYTEGRQLSVTNVNEDLYSFSAIGIYSIRLKHNNTLGGNIQHHHYITSSSYSGDYTSWQHLRQGETLMFLTYTQDFGEKFTLTFSPGGSLLNYKLNEDQFHRFWTFRTNSWIRYRFNPKHQVAAGFAMGNNQVELSLLSGMDQTVDFLQIKRGNPNLKNTKIQEFFFSYDAQIKPVNLQLNVWYSINPNNISSNYYIEGDKLVGSFLSNSSYHKLKAELLASFRISENLRANANLRYEYMNIPEKSKLNENNYAASVDVNYFLKSFTINAYAKTPERILDRTTLAFMKSPCIYGLSVRYNKQNWMAEVGTENPFTRHAHYREYADYGVYRYNQTQSSRIYQQTGYIKIAYTFDFGKKTSRESNNVNKNIDSAILKAK